MLKLIPGVNQLISLAIAEDLYQGDITTASLPQLRRDCLAKIILEEEGIIAGLELVEIVFRQLNVEVRLQFNTRDGCYENPGKDLLEIVGPAFAVLAAERIILNFIGRMSGIATASARLVSRLEGTKCRLLDTRKTTPGWRYLDKYSTHLGGVVNHRFGLDDGVLIKDNHLLLSSGIGEVIRLVRKHTGPLTKIAIEVENESQVKEALRNNADHLLLDNMTADQIRTMVAIVDGKAQTEASGGITPENLKEYASTGVDYLSLGLLTTEVRFLKMKMEIQV